MVLSKTSKEKNKTLMVMKFANGMKTASKISRNAAGSKKANEQASLSSGQADIPRPDRNTHNRNVQPSNSHENGKDVRMSQPPNRTRLSITHATSGLNSVEDESKSRDFLCYRTNNLKRKSVGNCDIRRASLVGSKGCMELKVATQVVTDKGNGKEPVNDEKGHMESGVAMDGNKDTVSDSSTGSFELKPDDTNNTDSNKEVDGNDIVKIIKEIESIPLVSLDHGNSLENGVSNGTTSRRLSKLTCSASNSTESQDTGITSQSTSPFSTRPSRLSNETPTSVLSNNSRSSQKSLAERIMERKADVRESPSASSSVLDSDSMDIPTASRQSVCGNSTCSSNKASRDSVTTGIDISGLKKTKHSPDLVAAEGENTRPIMRRRRVRKILTAE